MTGWLRKPSFCVATLRRIERLTLDLSIPGQRRCFYGKEATRAIPAEGAPVVLRSRLHTPRCGGIPLLPSLPTSGEEIPLKGVRGLFYHSELALLYGIAV